MYSMGIELISLIVMTANRSYLEKKTKKMFAAKGELTEIYNEEIKLMDKLEENLDKEEFETLLEIFAFRSDGDKEGSFGIGLWYYIFLDKGKNIEEFLSWVENLDGEEYFKCYSFGSIFKSLEEKVTKDNILDILDK